MGFDYLFCHTNWGRNIQRLGLDIKGEKAVFGRKGSGISLQSEGKCHCICLGDLMLDPSYCHNSS
jgi:hypothetical protein